MRTRCNHDLRQPAQAEFELKWPEDLRELVGRDELLQRIYAVQSSIEWPGEKQGSPNIGDQTPEPVFRTLVLYGLCVGVYCAGDIETAVREEKTFRYISAGYRPGRNALHQYRRRNRPAIEWCLREILLGGKQGFVTQNRCDQEAARRFLCSVQADSMAMDE